MKFLLRLINISLFCSGFTYIIDEFILAQTGTNILGNSSQQWPIIITSMLVSSALAIALTKFIPNKHIVTAFLTFEILLSLLGGMAPLVIMASYSFFGNHFLLVFYGTAMLIGFFHGFQPILIGYLNDHLNMELKDNFASVLSLDALGVAVGGFIYHKYIIGQIPLYHAAFFATAVNLFSASVVLYLLTKMKKAGKLECINLSRWFWLAMVFSMIISVWMWMRSEKILFTAEQQLFRDEIIHIEDTKYQHIVLTKNHKTGHGNMYLNTGLQFSTIDEGRYHENLVHPVMLMHSMIDPSNQSLNVLVLGGGDGFAVRELKKYRNINSITLVDLDPGVTKLAKSNRDMLLWNDSSLYDARLKVFSIGNLSSGNKEDVYMDAFETDTIRRNKTVKVGSVEILNADAYKFIEEIVKTKLKYDIVIIDFPDPRNEAIGKLYSDYFYHKVHQVLNKNGLIAIQAGSPIHSNHAYLCIGKTMMAGGFDILPYHDNVPSFEQWGWYMASKKEDRVALNSVIQRCYSIQDFDVPTSYITPPKFFANTIFGKDHITNWDEVEVNTTLHPVVYIYFTQKGWVYQ